MMGISAVALISLGSVGHKTVCTIAENHLMPQAKAAFAVGDRPGKNDSGVS